MKDLFVSIEINSPRQPRFAQSHPILNTIKLTQFSFILADEYRPSDNAGGFVT